MPRRLALLIALLAPSLASAADLPARSRIGAVFAAPAETVVVVREPVVEVVNPPLLFYTVPGYYGRPHSFQYRSYYGSSPSEIFGRLPYACGQYGYC